MLEPTWHAEAGLAIYETNAKCKKDLGGYYPNRDVSGSTFIAELQGTDRLLRASYVRQMRTNPGGIVRMIEHWVERYHQIGYRYDDKWRMLKGEVFRANLRAHRGHIPGDMRVK